MRFIMAMVEVTGLEPAASCSQTDLRRHFPLKIAFSAPFSSENRALRHSYLHCFRVLRNGRWSVMWSAGFFCRIIHTTRLSLSCERLLLLYGYYNSEQPLIQVKICTAVDKEKGSGVLDYSERYSNSFRMSKRY